jgi:hypothetical protein
MRGLLKKYNVKGKKVRRSGSLAAEDTRFSSKYLPSEDVREVQA